MTSAIQDSATAPEPLDIPPGASARVQIIDGTAKSYSAPIVVRNPSDPLSYAYDGASVQLPSGTSVFGSENRIRSWLEERLAISPACGTGPHQRAWLGLRISKNVDEILEENGVDVKGGAIEAVFWSHWHFDHTGDVSQFPANTALITGAGVKEAFFPAYPEGENSPLLSSDFEDREHRELNFDAQSKIKIGGLRAIDYFGDGSFFLLDTPGHAIGHICGLARVTSTAEGESEDTFVYMGSDTAHHGGEFRPTDYLPLPEQISPSPYSAKFPSICPGHIFETIHPKKTQTEPFYELAKELPHDHNDAVGSVERMQAFDAADNVVVVIAHDSTILNNTIGLEFFPHGTMKD